jgi:hypothetical protein
MSGMTCIGKVRDGKISLPDGVHLPEGAEVEVHFVSENAPAPRESFAERYKEFMGIVDDLPSDLAANLDHYLHGHPKK